jgi:hypothetical protein
MTVGFYFYFLAFYRAATISATECPSITIAFHPNAVNLFLKT